MTYSADSADAEAIDQIRDGLSRLRENTRPGGDKAWEVFKELIPNLWDIFPECDQEEFEEELTKATKFAIGVTKCFELERKEQEAKIDKIADLISTDSDSDESGEEE